MDYEESSSVNESVCMFESSDEEDSFVNNKRLTFGEIDDSVHSSDEDSSPSLVAPKINRRCRKIAVSDSDEDLKRQEEKSNTESNFARNASASSDSNEERSEENQHFFENCRGLEQNNANGCGIKAIVSESDDDLEEEEDDVSEKEEDDDLEKEENNDLEELEKTGNSESSFGEQISTKNNSKGTTEESFHSTEEGDGSSKNSSFVHNDSNQEKSRNRSQIIKDISVLELSDNKEEDVTTASVQEEAKNEDDVLAISDDDEYVEEIKVGQHLNRNNSFRQLKIDNMLNGKSCNQQADIVIQSCTVSDYANQTTKVSELRSEMLKCKNLLRILNVDGLPDNGQLLQDKHKYLENMVEKEEAKLKSMALDLTGDSKSKSDGVTWAELQAISAAVVPKTFGEKAMATYTTQKTLTMDRLKNLHDSLATRPDSDTFAEDPKGLKVTLLPHQKHALAWLIWREGQKPSGGILADDMGLGKTLTMISLMLKLRELNDKNVIKKGDEKRGRKKPSGGTLVICPSTLIGQWEGEVMKHCKRNIIIVEVHHGPQRETNANRLAKYDMVITTYKLIMVDHSRSGPLYNVEWARIILDEAHVIRNYKSQTSLAVCDLVAQSRWALTGTPVHNKELDLYALLKFLQCSPFNELQVWKQWVGNKNAGGQHRLNTVMASIMLRRTKEQLMIQGDLSDLPEKKLDVISVELDSASKRVYQKILIFSKTLFVQFLHQRTEKRVDFMPSFNTSKPNDEYYKLHKKVLQMHGTREVKSHEILVLLLRLRQICCHPSLIIGMLNDEYSPEDGIEEDGVDIDLLDKLNNLNIDEDINKSADEDHEKLNEAASKILNTKNPVFDKNLENEKIKTVKKIITDTVLPAGDKAIVVSQWTGMLQIVAEQLKNNRIYYFVLDGKVPVSKRSEIVNNFNDPSHKVKVLLLSLTAGGVGLNLVGGNHLLLLDLHWNPQLEAQAQDRIYRVGQKKTVFVYKIVTADTIEERIKALQDKKLTMADDILTGTKGNANKLSMDDLKMLFNVNNM